MLQTSDTFDLADIYILSLYMYNKSCKYIGLFFGLNAALEIY